MFRLQLSTLLDEHWEIQKDSFLSCMLFFVNLTYLPTELMRAIKACSSIKTQIQMLTNTSAQLWTPTQMLHLHNCTTCWWNLVLWCKYKMQYLLFCFFGNHYILLPKLLSVKRCQQQRDYHPSYGICQLDFICIRTASLPMQVYKNAKLA